MRRCIRAEIGKGVLPQGYELWAGDIGEALDWSGFGPVQKGDVGKRVWAREFGIVMENNEQRDARKGVR